ncbi:MAG: DUF3472 domain-containing protein [Fuerstiella sp.]|nr:DUF3472 domain-containing protein [Fuerstiella sp.]MCP4513107.1 DUF3472 domain-containing protein [Fuerstiella sp.]
MNYRTFICLTVGLFLPHRAVAAEIHIPAATAYLDPHHNAARISADDGITRWTGPETSVTWFGQLQTPGTLSASVVLRLQPETTSRLKLSIGEQSREVTVRGHATDSVTAQFGTFKIDEGGYHSFKLLSLNSSGQNNGSVLELVLVGTAVDDAHFNMQPRRNAASVHLAYPVPRDTQVSAFYCEMTGLEDPLWSYYMACGWHRGYFGMQVNSPTERRIIFSVWDSGNEGVDRNKVADENRVLLVDKGADVFSGSFGNEGTGGHSHLKFQWKTGEKQRFLVTAEPVDTTHTIFAGYYFHPDKKQWMLISSWKAPKEGRRLRGLYSFSENFIGRNGHVIRKALYGNQWIRDSAGEWSEITTAKFSHDATGKADRRDRFMGVEGGQFFLSHGGFTDGYTEFGVPFERPPTNRSPASMKLPPLPE